MGIQSIHHISITAPQDVIEKVVEFYVDILGLTQGYRPDFGIPGHWLYKDKHPMVHLLACENEGGNNGFFDHFAFHASGVSEMMQTLDRHNIHYDIFVPQEQQQTQLFLTDPAGIKVELNFIGEKIDD